VGQPQVTELTVEDGAPLHVKAVFEFVPAFSIEGYQDVTVPKPSVEITEEEFQARAGAACASRAPRLSRSRKTGRWWMATGRRSPTRVIEGEADAAPIRGRRRHAGRDRRQGYGGGFHHALRGAKPGQELKAEVIYPADYAEPSWPARPWPTTWK
jgi:trigger factor